jgi:hypothetical protein
VTVRHAAETRFRNPLLWRVPVLMEAELDDYAPVDSSSRPGRRAARAEGAGVAACATAVRRTAGAGPSAPECAAAVAESLLRYVKEIEAMNKENF